MNEPILNVGTGLGPALSGRAFDMFHSYSQIFAVYEVALAITCLLLVRLGTYVYLAPPKAQAALAGVLYVGSGYFG